MITTTTLSVRGSHRRKNSFIKSLSSSVYEQSVNIDWILHWWKETVEKIWPVSACLCLSVCPLFNWQGQSRDLVGLYLSGGPAWCQSCYLIKISDVFTLPLVSKKFLCSVLAARLELVGGSARLGLMRSYYADGAGQRFYQQTNGRKCF